MQQIELELEGGGVLTVSLRASLDAMPAVKQRPLVLVVPGGGYDHVSPREGDPVALQFAAAGYHTAVRTYSVGEGAQNYRPLRQLNEALALLRQNAGEWHILPDKIAVCGFSAGGHLAASTAILWDAEPVQTALGIHGTEARPDAVVLGYPVITAGEYRHDGSIVNLCGDDADLRATMSLENQVRDGLPGENHVFASFDDALHAYDCRSEVDMQAKIQVRLSAADANVINEDGTRIFRVKIGKIEFVDYDVTGNKTARFETSIGRIIFNRQRLPEDYEFMNYKMVKGDVAKLVADCCDRYPEAKVGPILDAI